MQTVFSYIRRKIGISPLRNVIPYTFPRFGIRDHTFDLRIEWQRQKSKGFFLGRSAHSGFLSISCCNPSSSLSIPFRFQGGTNETPVRDRVLAFVLFDTTAKCDLTNGTNGIEDFGKFPSVL